MIDRHLHWKFTAYNDVDVIENGNGVKWPVGVEVIGYESEQDATIAAGQVVQRDKYILTSVWECSTCGTQESAASAMNVMAAAAAEE
jgi:hypothetical protein